MPKTIQYMPLCEYCGYKVAVSDAKVVGKKVYHQLCYEVTK